MGNIASSSKSVYKNVQLNFNKAIPEDKHKDFFAEAEKLIEICNRTCSQIAGYKSCMSEIHTVNTNRDPDMVKSAYEKISNQVFVTKQIYEFSIELKSHFSQHLKILLETIEKNENTPILALEQALNYKLVHMLSLSIAADNEKITKPEILNDLSFYRRLLPKMEPEHQKITNQEVNTIVKFFINKLPLVSALSDAALQLARDDPRVLNLISALSNGLIEIVQCQKLGKQPDEDLKFLKAGVVCMIIFDNASPQGMICEHINYKRILKYLLYDVPKMYGPEHKKLVLVLRYGCKISSVNKGPNYFREL